MICEQCGEPTGLESDTETVWNADGDVGYHSYCAKPCSTCDGIAVTENPNGTWSCALCELEGALKITLQKIRTALERHGIKRDE